jgi:hypothetical protein
MTRIALPGITALLVVVALVGAASCNQAREPLSALTLTERELELNDSAGALREDAPRELKLNLRYQHRDSPLEERNWLTEDRLRGLGFSLDVPVGAPEAQERYGRQPPRVAWIAFEYDGPAWMEISRRLQRQQSPDSIRREADGSRLVAVDADLDVERLRQRHATGHLFVRAIIELVFGYHQQAPLVYGRISSLTPSAVGVPHHFRPTLAGITRYLGNPADRAPQPQYEVDLAIGSLGLPYVTDVRRTDK